MRKAGLKRWHAEHKNHRRILVYLDKKNKWKILGPKPTGPETAEPMQHIEAVCTITTESNRAKTVEIETELNKLEDQPESDAKTAKVAELERQLDELHETDEEITLTDVLGEERLAAMDASGNTELTVAETRRITLFALDALGFDVAHYAIQEILELLDPFTVVL
jgi:delta 1-pyrroline-5-carboxylate dehydrogenase